VRRPTISCTGAANSAASLCCLRPGELRRWASTVEAPLYCWYVLLQLEADMKLTAVFQKVREGYIGFVEELPGANTQARTLKQARANLPEAVELVLQANRTLSKKSIGKKKVIREPLVLAVE
jgi:predicted RNase H-like HicB family nuclease